MTNLHDPLLTVEEAAEQLGTGPGLPLRLVAEGVLDHVTDADQIRIPESALIAYAIGALDSRSPRRGGDSAVSAEIQAA
jgi:excisionase family DNA binding protein